MHIPFPFVVPFIVCFNSRQCYVDDMEFAYLLASCLV